MSALKSIGNAYRVFQDAQRRTCIRINAASEGVLFIPMDSSGLEVVKLSNKDFEQRFTIECGDYPVQKAAESYLNAKWIAVSEVAKKHLEYLTGGKFKDPVIQPDFKDKESIMTEKAQAAAEAKKTAKPAKKDAKPAAKKGAAKPAPKKVESPKAGKAAPTKVAAPKQEKTPREPKTAAGPDNREITLLSKENPKREGSASFDRYALYKNGMKVDQFIEAGGTYADIKYDEKKGFISLS